MDSWQSQLDHSYLKLWSVVLLVLLFFHSKNSTHMTYITGSFCLTVLICGPSGPLVLLQHKQHPYDINHWCSRALQLCSVVFLVPSFCYRTNNTHVTVTTGSFLLQNFDLWSIWSSHSLYSTNSTHTIDITGSFWPYSTDLCSLFILNLQLYKVVLLVPSFS